MSNFFIHNFGCRATHADAAAIRQNLLAQGFSLADSPAAADLVVLNTCTVTAAADAEARETIRRVHRENPGARIVVTGCYAQRAPEELAALEGVSWVVGNSHQHQIAPGIGRAADFVSISGRDAAAGSAAPLLDGVIGAEDGIPVPPIAVLGERTRPTLKIQDGCNHRCAYCVIPFVRGPSRSLPPARVVSEILGLVGNGAREVVLSGIDLGSYGRDLSPRASLRDVLCKILEATSLERLRLSSIEPMDITQDFVEFIAASDRIAPHFHLPLQSGSDRILRAMHRWYRAAHYACRAEMIRERLPHAAIGADVIAGFPSETDTDHRTTMDFLEALPLSYLHVFSFSARPGTAAATLGESVPLPALHARASALRALGERKIKDFRAAQAGQRLRVLTLDRRGDNWTSAISANYLKLRVAGVWPRNHWLDVLFDPASASAPLLATPVED